MNGLFKVNEDAQGITISARELYKQLGINERFSKWFDRFSQYGFVENEDFNPYQMVQVQMEGRREVSRNVQDYQLTIDMAKEIAMLQRNDKGKEIRKQLIALEKAWNTPEKVMARALHMAQRELDSIKTINLELENTIAVQNQQIAEMKPKESYYDLILSCDGLMSATQIAKDYGKSARWMNTKLHELGIQYKLGSMWLLYQKYAEQGYTHTKTHVVDKGYFKDAKPHTYWTQKGRLFIYDLLKKQDILPTIEKEG